MRRRTGSRNRSHNRARAPSARLCKPSTNAPGVVNRDSMSCILFRPQWRAGGVNPPVPLDRGVHTPRSPELGAPTAVLRPAPPFVKKASMPRKNERAEDINPPPAPDGSSPRLALERLGHFLQPALAIDPREGRYHLDRFG